MKNNDTSIIESNHLNDNSNTDLGVQEDGKYRDFRNPRYRDSENSNISEADIESAFDAFIRVPNPVMKDEKIGKGYVPVGTCPLTKKVFYRHIKECYEIEGTDAWGKDEIYYRLKDECYEDDNGDIKIISNDDLTASSKIRTVEDAVKQYALDVLEKGEDYFSTERNFYDWCNENDFRPWLYVAKSQVMNNDLSIDQYNRIEGDKKDLQYAGEYNKPVGEPLNLRFKWGAETSLEDKVNLTIAAFKGGRTIDDSDDLLNNPVRKNLLTNQIELNGKEMGELDEERMEFVRRHGKALSLPDFIAVIKMMASKNIYNPVAEKLARNFLRTVDEAYLQGLDYGNNRVQQLNRVKQEIVNNESARYYGYSAPKYNKLFPQMKQELANLEEFITGVWGITDEWYIEAVKHMMISAVARAFDPGCQVDTVTIFKSEQGYNKSSAFQVLAYDWFVSKRGSSTTNKDDIMESSMGWIEEYAEIERVTATRDSSETKDHFSKRNDNYRKPYAKAPKSYPRHWIMVGSTNNDTLFLDVDNRRYNVVEVTKAVDLEYLKKHRDEAWAMAVKLYLDGAKWWYSEDEEGADVRRERNRQYMYQDERSEAVLDGIGDNVQYIDAVCLAMILEGFEPDKIKHTPSSKSTKEAKNILKRSGWQKQTGRKVYVPNGRRTTGAYLNPNYRTDEERAADIRKKNRKS